MGTFTVRRSLLKKETILNTVNQYGNDAVFITTCSAKKKKISTYAAVPRIGAFMVFITAGKVLRVIQAQVLRSDWKRIYTM